MSFSNRSPDGHISDMMWGSPSELSFQGVPGDFYHKGDVDGMRGATISPCAAPGFSLSLNTGDYYFEQDDVVRGVSMAGVAGVPEDGLLGKAMGESGLGLSLSLPGPGSHAAPLPPLATLDETGLHGKDNGWKTAGSGFGFPQGLQGYPGYPGITNYRVFPETSRTPFEPFQPDDVPPQQPGSKHFKFEPTTMYMKTDVPYTLGLGVLDFLDSQVIASVSKVNRKKFTIKADAFLENVACSTKIRVWEVAQEAKGEFAVEFQRRAGDPFTFGDVYRQACFFLSGRFPGVVRGRPVYAGETLPALLLPVQSSERDAAEVAPLLEMAGMESLPAMQAEAAVVLANLSCRDPDIAKLLCNEDAFDQFAKLLASDRLDVNYPTSRLISSLMMYKEVERPLAEHCLLKVVTQKIASKDTDRIVCLELAKTVSAAARACAASMAPGAADELRAALEEAMENLQNDHRDSSMLQVSAGLQDALLELNQIHHQQPPMPVAE